jgi:predicted dehydrogenase
MRTSRRQWTFGLLAAPALQAEDALVRLPGKVRLGLLGLTGHPLDILGPLPRLPDVELAAYWETDPKELARYARNPHLSAARHYADWRAMLDRERFDMVAVCNSNGERAAAILECVERKLHVIAEKPLAIERVDLERVKRAIARSGVQLSMLLSMRFMPAYRTLHRVVRSGAIGTVALMTGQKSYAPSERPDWHKHRRTYGGTIPWIGIHMVDLMRWISGREMTEVLSFQKHFAFPEFGEMENAVASCFLLDNGGSAVMTLDYLRPLTARGDDNRLRLAGTEGVAEYHPATGVTLLRKDSPGETVPAAGERGSVFVDFLESAYNGRQPLLELADVYRVNEIVLAARDSAEHRRPYRL